MYGFYILTIVYFNHSADISKLISDKLGEIIMLNNDKIGNQIVLDPVKEEEEISDYRISLAIADNGGKPRITAIQKGKEGAISDEDMDKILSLLEKKFDEMFPKISKYVWGK